MAHDHVYLIALGSNQRHATLGAPRYVLRGALARLEDENMRVIAVAPTIEADPIGPSIRRYANAAAVIETELPPEVLLKRLKAIEREFGRRAGGRRWRARVLDLDIILWSGGPFAARGLTVPHALFRERSFVLAPAAAIAPEWRDPLTGRTVRQLHARLTRQRTLPKRATGRALSSVGRATDF